MNITQLAFTIAKLIHKPWICLIKHISKVDENIIVFSSTPAYSDNSRALSDYLRNNVDSSKYKICWSVKNAKAFQKRYKDSGIIFLESDIFSVRYFYSLWYFLRAKYLFGTHALAIPKSEGRREQVRVRLWHGCSYKDKSNADAHKETPFDFALVSGPIFQDIKSYYWNCDKELIHPLGFPRYDWLLNPSNRALSFYEKTKGLASKLIIWMPTFRNAKDSRLQGYKTVSHFPLLTNEDDWYKLNEVCRSNNVKLVIKTHTFQLDYGVDYSKFTNIICLTNSSFDEADVPMYEFISLTDALVSDYSSIAIDYLVVNKPLAFALDDYNEYKDVRGFVFDNPLDYMPGHHLYDVNDLCVFIGDVSNDDDKYEVDRMRVKNLCVTQSNHYCKDIIDALGL